MRNERSSFRDPSGYLFWHEGKLYRTVTDKYIDTYKAVRQSGLLDSLREENKIVEFKEQSAENFPFITKQVSLVLEPEILPFISYPYEWSFSQLKDAALLTLDLHIAGLKSNFLLKDASAYNIQFLNGKPIFIDHLSFDECKKYSIWPAYGQFCRHFLAPLVLMAKVDPGLNSLMKIYIDGIPLPLARKLIPARKLLSFGLYIHFVCHARFQNKYADKGEILADEKKLSTPQMLNIAVSLKETITKLKWKPRGTEWSEYYDETNYTSDAFQNKVEIISDFVKKIPCIKNLWDFGGNTGIMSRAVQEHAERIICFDIDAAAVEKNYLLVKKNKETKILPLVMDFTNPSSGTGFASQERYSLHSRGKADLGLALALVHHLAISNNIPLGHIAKYLSLLCHYLIIEFIPKEDSQVQRLLLSRDDVFSEYSYNDFIREFARYFEIMSQRKIVDSERTLFLMKTS
jgi:hypothetical protein